MKNNVVQRGSKTHTFSQEVLKVPSGVVLWVLQMDICSPPGSWGVVHILPKQNKYIMF